MPLEVYWRIIAHANATRLWRSGPTYLNGICKFPTSFHLCHSSVRGINQACVRSICRCMVHRSLAGQAIRGNGSLERANQPTNFAHGSCEPTSSYVSNEISRLLCVPRDSYESWCRIWAITYSPTNSISMSWSTLTVPNDILTKPQTNIVQ